MKIIRLISAEIKRLMQKPGIFILTAIFIVSLGFAHVIYEPTERDMNTIEISGADVDAIYTTFTNSYVNLYDADIDDLQDYLDFYACFEKTYTDEDGNEISYSFPDSTITKEELLASYTEAETTYNLYKSNMVTSTLPTINSRKDNLKLSLTNLYDDYIFAVGSVNTAFFVTTAEDAQFRTDMNSFIALIPNEDLDETENETVVNNLKNYGFLNTIKDFLNSLYVPVLEPKLTSNLAEDYITETNIRLASLSMNISEFSVNNGTSAKDEDKATINEYISEYYNTVYQTQTIITNTIELNLLEDFSNAEINELKDYSTFNSYKKQEELLLNKYLYKNKDFYFNYSSALSAFTTSNAEITSFDFAVYALEFFGFMVVLYLITVSAGSIIGEEANGTLKMLAVRPIKRSKIFNGKMITNIILAGLLIAIGVITASFSGRILYSINYSNVITIFNANAIIVMSPFEMLALYGVSLFIKVVFYIILAMFISMITKSSVIGSSITYFIYFATFVLGEYAIGSSALIYKILPSTSAGLFKYISPNYSITLDSVIVSDFGFLPAVVTLVAYSISMWVLSLIIFKRRDLK